MSAVPGVEDGVVIPVSLDTAALATELRAINELLVASLQKVKEEEKPEDEDGEEGSKKWKKYAVAATAFGVAAAYAIRSVVKESIESEKNERRWMLAIQLRGKATEASLTAHRAFIQATSQQTAIDDDALFNLQEQLSLRGVANAQLDGATKAVIGLSAVTGDLGSATSLYSRVLDGNTKALARYGITAKDSKDATEILTKMYALAADNTKTFGGQLELAAVNVGNFEQALGDSVTKSDQAYEGIKSTNKIIVQFTDYLGGDGKGLVDDFFSILNTSAQYALIGVIGLTYGIDKLIDGINYFNNDNFTEQLDEQGNVVAKGLEGLIIQLDNARIALKQGQAAADAGKSGRGEQTDPKNKLGPKSHEDKDTPEDKKMRQGLADEQAYAGGAGLYISQADIDKAFTDYQKNLDEKAKQERENNFKRQTELTQDAIAVQGQGYREKLSQENNQAQLEEDIARQKLDAFTNASAENRAAVAAALSDENAQIMQFGYQKVSVMSTVALLEEAQNRKTINMLIGTRDQRKQILGQMVDHTAQFGAEIVQGLLAHTLNAKAAAEKFFGTILSSMGRYLIGLGGANLVAGLFPPDPVALAAGAAQVAFGATLAGAGAALSGKQSVRETRAKEAESAAKDREREREETLKKIRSPQEDRDLDLGALEKQKREGIITLEEYTRAKEKVIADSEDRIAKSDADRSRAARSGAASDQGGRAFDTRGGSPINIEYHLSLQGFGIGSPAFFGQQVLSAVGAAGRLSDGRSSLGGI